jgi:O-antigen/teichoic acid export membrane protein
MGMPYDSLTLISRWAQGKRRLQRMVAGDSRRQLIISISSLAGSGLISVALRFLGGIIQGRFVGPDVLGYYTKFTILPAYLFILHLGVFTSLARQYPFYVGKGERDTAVRYAANALGWTRLLCAVHALIFAIPCLWALGKGDWPAALGWGTQILLSTTSLYMFYLGSTYRNSSEFVAWSKATVISSIASLLFLPLVAVYQFAGVCVRYSIPALVAMLYAHLKRPLRMPAQWNPGVLKKMIAFGAPLMVFAYIANNLWVAVERTYILRMTNETTLGVFTFAGTLCVALVTVATSISQVFHPRIAAQYGASGNNMAVVFQYCMRCSGVGLAAMLPLVVLTYWLIDPLVTYFLPKYIESIPIARCLVWLSLTPVIDQPKQLLIVAKRTKLFGFAVSTGFVLFLAVLTTFAMMGDALSLKAIVLCSVACKMASVFISNALCWREARRTSRAAIIQG